eukprot:scaffold137_cov398-Prasinococcus_capsulatus_cf.AAC.64
MVRAMSNAIALCILMPMPVFMPMMMGMIMQYERHGSNKHKAKAYYKLVPSLQRPQLQLCGPHERQTNQGHLPRQQGGTGFREAPGQASEGTLRCC